MILKRRENLRTAFAGFDPYVLCNWGQKDFERLFHNVGIIRHRRKIEAALSNAKAWRKIEKDIGFTKFLLDYVNSRPIINSCKHFSEVPSQTPLSHQISKDLKKTGLKFCGPTKVYAFLQAAGFINDHLVDCPFKHKNLVYKDR